MKAHRTALAALALGAALTGLFAPEASAQAPRPARAWNLRSTPVVGVVRRVKDAVVNIHSERTVRGPAAEELFSLSPSQNRVNGMGTGIIIDPRGYIITNQHVVDDVSTLRCRLADGTTVLARIVARDTENDLALLKINVSRMLPVMPLGTAKDLEVGETMIAIGNAYGYDHTVTVGVVSAVGRDVTLNREVRYRSLIQTDASINPGNSGGPLINLEGELVGVNVAIRAGAQGIGFAIPVDTMIRVAGQMLDQERARTGAGGPGLGLHDDIASTSATRRVVVDRVEGPAARAGLQRGDVVVRVAGVKVLSSLDVHRAVLGHEPGQKVAVVVRRDGVEKAYQVHLDKATAGEAAPTPAAPAGGMAWRKLGLRLAPLANRAEVARTHPKLNGGMSITDVRPDSPAWKAGLRRGDILIGLHQWEMLNAENVHYVLAHPDRHTFNPLQFYILRAGQVHRGWLSPAE